VGGWGGGGVERREKKVGVGLFCGVFFFFFGFFLGFIICWSVVPMQFNLKPNYQPLHSL